jgi:SnoaL-like domain
MAVPGPSPTAGIEQTEPIAAHRARTAARLLAASFIESWDRGDASAFAALFTPDGRWTDPTGQRHSDLATRFDQWRAWEPWSVHWLSNEEVVVVTETETRGTWLWSAASSIDHGATPAWSGGDVTMVTQHSAEGWKIAELSMTDRYRTPYQTGWLSEPNAAVELGDGPSPTVSVTGHQQGGTPSVDASDDGGIESLGAEVALRALMWGFIDDLETEAGGVATAHRWTERGTLELVGLDGASMLAVGATEVAKALDDEGEHPRAVMRVLFSGAVDVDGDRAGCRWRDLWTAFRDTEAVWLAHNYEIKAVRDHDTWRFDSMVRTRVLDCPYESGWLPFSGPRPGPVGAER